MPGELPPGVKERPTLAPDKRPTPTPNDIEAKNLPKKEVPKRKPITMIDTAPDVPHKQKYQIIIKRREDKIAILVPVGIEKDEILNEYFKPERGDELLHISYLPTGRDEN